MIVYEVNHAATGKATYSNLAVNGADVWNGVRMVHDPDFNGTAAEYIPDNPNAKYLYVYKVARKCNGDPHCYELPYGPGAYGIKTRSDALHFLEALYGKCYKDRSILLRDCV